MATGTFIGRFRGTDRVGQLSRRIDDAATHANCTCKRKAIDWEGLTMIVKAFRDAEAEEESRISGEPAEEVEEKKRREEEEAAERERQEREAVEAAKRDDDVSHEPPNHPHQPGEAYGIQRNLGDAMRRFLAGVDAKYKPRKAPTSGRR